MIRLSNGEIWNLGHFSKYASAEDFREHMVSWLYDHKRDFSKSELVGFKWLGFFSEEIPGVCHVSIHDILSTIHEDCYDSGISRATFKRMIKKATTLGIITVYETQKENGSQDSNLYVFNRFTSE